MDDMEDDDLGMMVIEEALERVESEAGDTPDTRDWTCECYPEFSKIITTSVPPIPAPPYPDPCCCYGLPEFRKPGPRAFYLGMGYKAPNMRGPEYLRTPGYFPRQPGLEKYTVKCCGHGLLPPFNEGDLKQEADVVDVYVITGSDGFQVEVTEYGARLMAIRAPDVDGVVKNVLLGFDSPEVYWRYSALHWGGVAGRLADRIRGPRPNLRVPGVGWCLFPQNDEDDHFMGGEKGLDRVIWDAHVQDNGVLFTHLSRAGHEDYPGDVIVFVSYTVLPVNRLVIHMEATTTVATPFALMLPLIFNLAGHNSGEIAMKEHVLTVHSDKYYTKGEGKRVTGAKKLVATTPYDLRIPRELRKILRHAPNNSYDVLMCMRHPRPGTENDQHLMAKLFHPNGRRVMEVWSDQPVLHLATNLGLTRRPRKPPDAVLLDEARKIIEEIIAKIIPCEDLLPPRKTFFDIRKNQDKNQDKNLDKNKDENKDKNLDENKDKNLDKNQDKNQDKNLGKNLDKNQDKNQDKNLGKNLDKNKDKNQENNQEKKQRKSTFVDREEDIQHDKSLKELNESRPPPNPGDIRTIPKVDRKESEAVAKEIIEEILSRVKARPPVYLGYNSYRYFDDCGIMLYPRLPPLLPGKINLDELVLRPGQRYSHTTTYVFSTSPRPVVRKRRRFGRKRPHKKASELMIDHCSATSLAALSPKESFIQIHDVCSVEFPSEPSI